jgi:hypothetical protein
VPPVALHMLALPEGTEVDIRAVHSGALGAAAGAGEQTESVISPGAGAFVRALRGTR